MSKEEIIRQINICANNISGCNMQISIYTKTLIDFEKFLSNLNEILNVSKNISDFLNNVKNSLAKANISEDSSLNQNRINQANSAISDEISNISSAINKCSEDIKQLNDKINHVKEVKAALESQKRQLEYQLSIL